MRKLKRVIFIELTHNENIDSANINANEVIKFNINSNIVNIKSNMVNKFKREDH